MKFISPIFLAASFLLALVFGAQTAEWSWGPAFLALGLAVVAGIGSRREAGGRAVGLAMLPAAGWILYRGLTSDVMDFARADAMLVLVVLATAWVVSGLRGEERPVSVLFSGLAVVSAINLGIAVVQSQTPEFMWPYHHRPSNAATGFFGHYNYFANYTLGAGLLLAARGFFSRDHFALRFLFISIAFWSAAMVVVSGSRGGTLAMGVGIVVLVGCGAVLAWRGGAWWSKVFLVAFPLLLVGAGFGGWKLMSGVLERRGGGDLNQLADNSARLEWIDLSLRVAGDHPLAGGGSRAFSWERNRHWEVEDMGRRAVNERFVHNELLQTVTDYGAVGAILIILPIGFVGWFALSRLFLGGPRDDDRHMDSVAAGILGAGGAVLVQANFSFVFHLLPSTMLLGLLFGMAAWLPVAKPGRRELGRSTAFVPGLPLAASLLWLGGQATRSLERAWPVLYAESSLVRSDPGRAITRLEDAARFWPGHRFFEEAANHARLAALDDPDDRDRWNHRAARLYQQAEPLHPHHPGIALNLANTLSELGRIEEAEKSYERAITLQGGLESAFNARYFYAKHRYELWHHRWTEERRSAEALWHFLRVRELLVEAENQGRKMPDRDELRKRVDEAIAFLEAARVEPQAPKGGLSE